MLALALAGAACGSASPPRPAGPVPLGSQPLVARSPAEFAADLALLRGRVVVVNFWATWCQPCRVEMPELEEVARAYADRPVTIIGVNSSDERERAAAFLRETGVSYPTVFDPKGIYGGVASEWSVTGLPQTWFIDTDGARAGRVARQLGRAELRQRIDQLLAE